MLDNKYEISIENIINAKKHIKDILVLINTILLFLISYIVFHLLIIIEIINKHSFIYNTFIVILMNNFKLYSFALLLTIVTIIFFIYQDIIYLIDYFKLPIIKKENAYIVYNTKKECSYIYDNNNKLILKIPKTKDTNKDVYEIPIDVYYLKHTKLLVKIDVIG